jgi:hypothetical protein
MRLSDSHSSHESGNIVRERLSGISIAGFVGFTGPSEVERDAREILGVLCDLKGVTRVIGGEVRNENEGISGPLLLVVHGDVVRSDLGHRRLSIHCWQELYNALESDFRRERVDESPDLYVLGDNTAYRLTASGTVAR